MDPKSSFLDRHLLIAVFALIVGSSVVAALISGNMNAPINGSETINTYMR